MADGHAVHHPASGALPSHVRPALSTMAPQGGRTLLGPLPVPHI